MFSFGSCHKSKTIDIIEYEKINPETGKLVKLIKNAIVMVVVNHSFLLSK